MTCVGPKEKEWTNLGPIAKRRRYRFYKLHILTKKIHLIRKSYAAFGGGKAKQRNKKLGFWPRFGKRKSQNF